MVGADAEVGLLYALDAVDASMSILAKDTILHLKAPVRRVTGFDTMPPLAKLEDYFHPDVDRVVDEIIATMEF